MQASELRQRIESNSAPVIVDQRSEIEFRKGHIPGAVNAPPRKILFKTAKLPEARNTEIVVYCEHGQRAWLARKLLGVRGYGNTTFLEGHLKDWKKAGLPLEK